MASNLRASLALGLSLVGLVSALAQHSVGLYPIGGSDAKNNAIVGSVKSVVESSWQVDFSRNVVEKGPMLSCVRFVYNDKGFVLSTSKLDAFGDPLNLTRYVYDAGRLVSAETFAYGGNGASADSLVLVGSLACIYSASEPDKSLSMVQKDGKGVELCNRKVLRNSLEVDVVEAYNDMTSVHSLMKYDALGRLLSYSVEYFKDNQGSEPEDRSGEYRFKLADNGLPDRASFKTRKRERQTFSYDYKLDSMGNWVRCVISINGVPSFLQERVFEY